jgi:SNF2 family DNA or RNA helicase
LFGLSCQGLLADEAEGPDVEPGQLSVVLEDARQRVPSSLAPENFDHFSALLLLAAYGDVSALVRMDKLGLGNVVFKEDRRIALFEWYTGHFLSGGGAGEASSGVEGRVAILWNQVEQLFANRKKEALQIGEEIASFLPARKTPDLHQLEAVVRLRELGWKMLLADDMGLGKTIALLCAILLRGDLAFPVFVGCPASMVYTWKREAGIWLSSLSPEIVHIDSGFSAVNLKNRKRLFLVSSYEQLISHWKGVLSLHPLFLVGDESHYLMNWEAQRTRAFIRLRSSTTARVLMTGTPMPNGRFDEIYSQLKILDDRIFSSILPSVDGDRHAFRKMFCDPKVFTIAGRKVHSYNGRSNELEFGRFLQDHMLERTKAEVGMVLGDKVRYRIAVELSDKDRVLLAAVKDAVATKVRDRVNELIAKCGDSGRVSQRIEGEIDRILGAQTVQELTELRIHVGLLKAEWAMTLISEIVNDQKKRVVVFTAHHKVADRLVVLCRGRFGDSEVLVGRSEMSAKQRDVLVQKAEGGYGKILILPRAFREGITLVSFVRMIMVERWWVPGEEAQAEDRIHRRGQTKDVAIYYPHADGTSDDAMAELVTWKERGQQVVRGSSAIRVLQWLVPEVVSMFDDGVNNGVNNGATI